MTTYVPFNPSLTGIPPWTGQFTLDGTSYQGIVTWNIYSQRFYLSLAQQNQAPVWYGPLIGSPLDADILLAPGVFSASTILYRVDTGNFETVP